MTTGLNPTGKSSGGASGATALTEQALIDNGYATAIGQGDPVLVVSGYVVSCAENQVPTHILVGISYQDAVTGRTEFANSYPASLATFGSADVTAYLMPVENNVFYIETADAALALANIGGVFRLKSLGRNAATGKSTAVVDLDAAVTTEQRLVKILNVVPKPGNALGGTAVDVEVVVFDPDAT